MPWLKAFSHFPQEQYSAFEGISSNMAQYIPSYPGGAFASPYSVVSAMFNGQFPEGLMLDAKQKAYSKPYDFLKDVASFANARGGAIVLGAAEDRTNRKWIPLGIEHASRHKDQLQDWLKALEAPGVSELSLEYVPFAEKDFLVIQIPRVRFRPVCIFSENQRCEFWIRDGDRNRPMTFTEVTKSFESRYYQNQRSAIIAESLRRRFDDADVSLREVRIQILISTLRDPDALKKNAVLFHQPFHHYNIKILSEPILLLYDIDLHESFGNIPETWVNNDSNGNPHTIRLPGSSILLHISGPSKDASDRLLTMFKEAGRLCKNLLHEDQVFRRTLSLVSQLDIDPEILWTLCIALEASRLPPQDSLHRPLQSTYQPAINHSVAFDYKTITSSNFHPPFGHIISVPELRQALMRQVYANLDVDNCLLSSIVLLDALHRSSPI